MTFDVKKARALLARTTAYLKSLGINSWLDCGTLLGAVREGAFLSHDTDVDIGYSHKDGNILLNGDYDKFNLRYVWRNAQQSEQMTSFALKEETEENIRMEANTDFDYIDIYRWGFEPELKEITFEEGTYKIPVKYDKYLSKQYSNWRVPSKEHGRPAWGFIKESDLEGFRYTKGIKSSENYPKGY